MKKFLNLIAGLLLGAVLLGFYAAPALAADPPKLKVYYSESIGQGEKIFQVRVCNKVPAIGSVSCTQDDVGKPKWGAQCDTKDDIGSQIKGCFKLNDEKIPGTSLPAVDIAQYGVKKPNGCQDDVEQQGVVYGQVYAVFPNDVSDDDLDNESKIESEVVAPFDARGNSTEPNVEGKRVKPMYQSNVCATFDKLAVGGEWQMDEQQENMLQKIGSFDITVLADEASCNSTVHESRLDPETLVSCTALYRITGSSGTDILGQYISQIYKWASGVVGIIAVLIMVFSGIQISMAGGDSAKIDEAKNRIMKSIVGIVILFLSGLILYTINPTFFTGG